MQDGPQTPESDWQAPLALTDPSVVETLGGENVMFVIVCNNDGSTRTFYPDVEGNRVVVTPFDAATIWETVRSALRDRMDECSGFSIEQGPGNTVCQALGGLGGIRIVVPPPR